MQETQELARILRESFVAQSPKGRSVRAFRVLCDIMPGDRERIADVLDRLSRLERAAEEAADFLENECENCNRYTAKHCIDAEGFCLSMRVAKEIRDALAEARQ